MADTDEQPTVWTIGRLLDWTAKWFRERQVEGGRLAAELLLARALNCRKIDLYTRYDSKPSEDQRRAFRELVRQAGEYTPIAYLLGSREFFSLEFQVGPAVLIPRPETEALAQRMIDLCRSAHQQQWQILDLGTGSGCVAVAVAKYAPNALLVASDISKEALAVAQANIDRHGLSHRIRTVLADGFHLPAECVPKGGFDAVVSNPPYISESVYQNLPPHIRDHEPRVALVPPCNDGLEMYRRFATEAPEVLAPGGRLLAEIGHDQLAAVRGIFESAGRWEFIGTHRDKTDPHERVVELQLR
ncbi:MAG: peptide chain release factor N(5)-glutamine methyltransferase [Phycisphaerae bacterium]